MEEYTLKVKSREKLGRAATRALRRSGYLPVNVYGHKKANRHVAIEYRELDRFIRAGHRLLTLDDGKKPEHGVVTEIQYDSLGTRMIHVDVTRVDREERITMAVPVATFGVSKGQTAGGTLDINLKELEIEGPAGSIPEKIEIPIAELEIGQSVRVRDLTPPPSCKFEHDEDEVILAVHTKVVVEEEPIIVEESLEPEVISRKKEDEEDSDKESKD